MRKKRAKAPRVDYVGWSHPEHVAWRAPETITPSAWAERYRELSRRQSSRPGPWRNANSPCLVGIMDLCNRPAVRKLNIKKAGQIGASEAIRNVIAYYAHQEPDPVLLVLPDEKTGRKIMRKRILPLIEDTPVLRELLTEQKRDKKLTEISLSNGFVLSLGWAGSAASLASDPARVVINDEVDKMKAWVGKEADPISLGDIRTATYENSLQINISTPTTRLGLITQLHEKSAVKLWFFAPCPHCGTFQKLTFDRIKWASPPKDPKAEVFEAFWAKVAAACKTAAGERFARSVWESWDASKRAGWVEEHRAAWYECCACPEPITDQHRPKMLTSGYWGTDPPSVGGWKLWVDGREEGCWPTGSEVGVHLWAIHSLAPKHRLPSIAAEFIRCDGDPMKLQNLYNSWLGETFEQQVTSKERSIFSAKCQNAPPPRLLPTWASRLVMSVDTQKDHFYYVIRAWGHNFHSRRIDHGRATSFEELREIAFATWYRYEGDVYAAQCCYLLGIDSGGGTRHQDEWGLDASRTDEVYRFALSDLARIKALRGDPHPVAGQAIRLRRVTYRPPDQSRSPYEVFVHQLDTGWFQDILDSRIDMKAQAVDKATGELLAPEDVWELNAVDDPDYNAQMASMHKVVVDPRTREMRWVTKTSGAANHYRDCEVYQWAMAMGPARCGELPPEEVLVEQLRMAQQMEQRGGDRGGLKTPDGRPYLVTRR